MTYEQMQETVKEVVESSPLLQEKNKKDVLETLDNLVKERETIWENLLKSYEVATKGG